MSSEAPDEARSAPTLSAGALLRDARKAQGLHLAAIAASIKVTPQKLEALENVASTSCPMPPSRARWRRRCAGC